MCTLQQLLVNREVHIHNFQCLFADVVIFVRQQILSVKLYILQKIRSERH